MTIDKKTKIARPLAHKQADHGVRMMQVMEEPKKEEKRRVVSNVFTNTVAVWYLVNDLFIEEKLKEKPVKYISKAFRGNTDDLDIIYYQDGSILRGNYYIEFQTL